MEQVGEVDDVTEATDGASGGSGVNDIDDAVEVLGGGRVLGLVGSGVHDRVLANLGSVNGGDSLDGALAVLLVYAAGRVVDVLGSTLNSAVEGLLAEHVAL